MRQLLVILSCALFCCVNLFAQSPKRLFREADALFEEKVYNEALAIYLEGLKADPDHAEANFKAGLCHLETTYKEKAVPFLEKAFRINPGMHPNLLLFLGEAYQYDHQFPKALQTYTAFSKTPAAKDVSEHLNRKMYECQNGIRYLNDPVKALIDNIGSTINSKYPDYAPVISADESVMVFTSRREGSTGKQVSMLDGQYYEDLYISYKANGQWTAPRNIMEVNTDKHDACIALSPDGKQLFIYRDGRGGDIYASTFDAIGNTWSKPQSLGDNVNTKYYEPSVSMTADGNTIYFSSNRPGGLGGLDIYVSRKDSKGNWGPATNLGAPVNTSRDDDAPFIHADGQTLYFSSRGHAGMGGYDIYRSAFDETAGWSQPENLGYPINTAGEDSYFVLSADNKHGYYASAKEGGHGEKDIYLISMPKPKELTAAATRTIQATRASVTARPVEIKQVKVEMNTNTTILKGHIIDAFTKQPLEAGIVLTNNENAEVITEQKSDTAGFYLTVMPSGKNYRFVAEKDGYLFHSENYEIPPSKGYQEIVLDVELKRVSVGSRIILRNIFFDFDQATLKKESTAELRNLLEIMTELPTLKIEISGHTDAKGSAEYNKKLSERRAKAVVDYLIAKGVAPERFTYKGFGMERPLVSNDDEAGRALNRRTEFLITGN
jgi:outer membrane protein OmpA-like peptidoglycan-associated protein/tetratricopeptide (TPR) repeat protein